jgi:hypothetical protein
LNKSVNAHPPLAAVEHIQGAGRTRLSLTALSARTACEATRPPKRSCAYALPDRQFERNYGKYGSSMTITAR